MTELAKDIILIIVTVIVTLGIPKLVKLIIIKLPGRGKIKRVIERGINAEIYSMVEETCGLNVLRHGIKVEWDENVDNSTYLTEEGDVVVKLSYKHDKNQSRNFTKVLMLYLEESFLPEAKPFMGSVVHEGCRYTIAKEITFKKDTEAYRHFLASYLSPLFGEGGSLEQLMRKLELISQRGSFRSVLLREAFFLCEGGNLPNSEMRDEVKKFVDFLWNIANKIEYEERHGVEPTLEFIKRFIKVQIVLVKRREAEDFSSHVRAGEIGFRRGARSVYIAGWGENNIIDASNVADELKDKGFTLIKELKFNAEFPEEVKPGICFVFGR